jgi:peptidoglycan hydrolase-like protein with peptidoglycan-binding domain
VGTQGDDVSLIQTLLAQDSSIYPEGQVSGYYGKLTSAAVKKFQAKYGISQTGTVGPLTRAKLMEVYSGGAAASVATGSQSAAVSSSITRNLSSGTEGDDVTMLQTWLSQDPSVYPEARVTGYYGALTVTAVKRFQAKFGISQTGTVGPITRAKLMELYGK